MENKTKETTIPLDLQIQVQGSTKFLNDNHTRQPILKCYTAKCTPQILWRDITIAEQRN